MPEWLMWTLGGGVLALAFVVTLAIGVQQGLGQHEDMYEFEEDEPI